MERYHCPMCGYVYDPAIGEPVNGVASWTSFEALPPDWVCPVCEVRKNGFSPEPTIGLIHTGWKDVA